MHKIMSCNISPIMQIRPELNNERKICINLFHQIKNISFESVVWAKERLI